MYPKHWFQAASPCNAVATAQRQQCGITTASQQALASPDSSPYYSANVFNLAMCLLKLFFNSGTHKSSNLMVPLTSLQLAHKPTVYTDAGNRLMVCVCVCVVPSAVRLAVCVDTDLLEFLLYAIDFVLCKHLCKTLQDSPNRLCQPPS